MNATDFSRYLFGIKTCHKCGECLLPQGGHADLCNKEPKWFVFWAYGDEKLISFSCSFWNHFGLGIPRRLNLDLYSALLMTFEKFDICRNMGDYDEKRLEVYNFVKEWIKRRHWWRP